MIPSRASPSTTSAASIAAPLSLNAARGNQKLPVMRRRRSTLLIVLRKWAAVASHYWAALLQRVEPSQKRGVLLPARRHRCGGGFDVLIELKSDTCSPKRITKAVDKDRLVVRARLAFQ